MDQFIDASQLIPFEISQTEAEKLAERCNQLHQTLSNEATWQTLNHELSYFSFNLNLFIFKKLFPQWPHNLIAAPVWFPTQYKQHSHLENTLQHFNHKNIAEFQRWSAQHYILFWQYMIETLGISFKKPYIEICNLDAGIETPAWLYGGKLNIADSCFSASSSKTALVFLEGSNLRHISYEELNKFSNRVANSLQTVGYQAGDAIAIDMPMNYLAVAIYLGIIKMGGVVVSIADSFSPEEIAVRLKISKAKAIFTQDVILRASKTLPLYEKVKSATTIQSIVIITETSTSLRKNDLDWELFLVKEHEFTSYPCDPMMNCNILFSSGTTGEPKAIPWKHCTPIKVASDAYLHQDIQPSDVLAWPTNLGWMMGPWLIFAALMNKATIALYDDVPRERAFGEFIEKAKVTMLGVVPTLVANWRQSKCMEGLNWENIKLYSSTGECSNPEDMFYLMWLAHYKPVIEYCGGTEIGGGYITSTVLEKNYPSVCTTPAFGSNFILMNEKGELTDNGEVAVSIPALGLSTELLNADHNSVYFKNMPRDSNGIPLRRHGDQICRLANGYYSVLGRADDTMNLGGIKTSSAEIERVLVGTPGILETAAIATMGQGPSQLVIFAATQLHLDKEEIKQIMQKKINQHLNPLFRISDVIFLKELPKTASNKIMRRVLRDQYKGQHAS